MGLQLVPVPVRPGRMRHGTPSASAGRASAQTACAAVEFVDSHQVGLTKGHSRHVQSKDHIIGGTVRCRNHGVGIEAKLGGKHVGRDTARTQGNALVPGQGGTLVAGRARTPAITGGLRGEFLRVRPGLLP